ncbi:MAG: energy-coupling factor transporter ATPase [Clostridia bacterium]|nr:energy-coupling factor transporter ATPase [Clostridia bacterium]
MVFIPYDTLGNRKNIVLEAKNLSFEYPGDEDTRPVPALRDVSFAIEEGSFTAILGHNGSGKSTLAKLLCMIYQPTAGQILLNGRDMTADGITEADIMGARREIGMVFQNPDNQIVATVVEEDVAFGCENLGIPSDEIRRRVDEALDIVGMRKYARHAPHKLSGGQKQRVAIAGTIAMKRKIIIFDESTAMLDPLGRKEVMDTILRLNREDGITVLIITHYMNEAAMADRVIVMNEGQILTDGTPGEVFSHPEPLWDVGLDVPQTTELLYKLKKDGYDVPLDVFDPEQCARIIAKALERGRG